MCYEYRSEDSLVQHLSLKHLYVNVSSDNNAPAQLNDCIEGLLHLGQLLHLGLTHHTPQLLGHIGLQNVKVGMKANFG